MTGDNRSRDGVSRAHRIVVKVGSGVLSEGGELRRRAFGDIARQISALCDGGREVVLVSSGAIAIGSRDLGWNIPSESIPEKQAAASVGQIGLIELYKKHFARNGRQVGQILVTRGGLEERERFLNARHTLFTLLSAGVVPIVNENDTVATEEIRFGDNDNLSAMTTNLVEAQLLVILSDVDGLYDSDPRHNTEARLISEVERITPEIEAMAGREETLLGTGGMTTKLKAAKRATLFGAGTAIINGLTPHNLLYLFDGHELGTYFLPARDPMAARKHWIAFTKKPKGKLILDDGAHSAVAERGKSLLPSGIRQLDGTFERGDAVRLCDLNGKEFAKGVTNYNSAELIRIIGKNTREILQILGYQYGDEVVHRDNLVISN